MLFLSLQPQICHFVSFLLVRWIKCLPFFREEERIASLFRTYWTVQTCLTKSQKPNGRNSSNLEKKKSCRCSFSFCMFLIFAPSAFGCCSYCCESFLTQICSEIWRPNSHNFDFCFICRCAIFCSSPTFQISATCSTITAKKKKQDLSLWKKRSELHATAACLIKSDPFWPFQSHICFHLHKMLQWRLSTLLLQRLQLKPIQSH